MFFRKSLSFAMTVTTLLTVFTKEHCFSKKNLDWIRTKMLEINVKYRFAKKTSFFLLIYCYFLRYTLSFPVAPTKLLTVFIKATLIFSKMVD